MGIEERLDEEESPRGIEKKRTWRRRLAGILEKNSTENSAGIGLIFSGILAYTALKTGTLRERLPYLALGGMFTTAHIKIGIEWVVDLLMREKEQRKEDEGSSVQKPSFFERYWHMIPGMGAGIMAGKYLTHELADRLGHIHNALSRFPLDLDYHLLYATTTLDIGFIYGTQIFACLAGATFLRAVATQVPLSYVVADVHAKLLILLGKTEDAAEIYQCIGRKSTPQGAGSARYALARLQKRDKDQGGFMLNMRNLFDMTLSLKNKIGFDPLTIALFRQRIAKTRRTRERKPSLDNSLELAYQYADQEYYTLADEVMEKTAQQHPTPEMRLFYAIYREIRQDTSLSTQEEKRRSLVEVLKAGESQQAFQQQGEHRNEVLFYKPQQSVFLAGTLVYKRNQDPTGLQTEEANLQFLRVRLGNRVVRVLDAFVDTGLHYLALLYAGERTLADDAPRNGQQAKHDDYVERLRLCLDLLVDIQYVMETNMTRIPLDPVGQRDDSYFTKRVHHVFFGQLKQYGIAVDSNAEEVVLHAHGAINDELRALPRSQLAFYTDANPGNWFVDERGKITRGDLESNRLLPQYFDLLLLFDFLGGILKEDERRALEMHYVQARARRFGTAVDLRAFDRTKRIAGYHKHLEQAGYKARDAELSRRAGRDPAPHLSVLHYHLERGRDYLEGMIERGDVPREKHGLLREAGAALREIRI